MPVRNKLKHGTPRNELKPTEITKNTPLVFETELKLAKINISKSTVSPVGPVTPNFLKI